MLALASGSLLGATAATVAGAPVAPTGKYVGGVSVLGTGLLMTLNVKDTTMLDFQIQGAVDLECTSEKYAYDGATTITLPDNVFQQLHRIAL